MSSMTDSRIYCPENNSKVKVTKSPENTSESESKRRKFSNHKSFEENKPNFLNNDKHKEPKESNTTKASADAHHIYNKPVEWLRCSPADLFYEPQRDNSESVKATNRLIELKEKFRVQLLERSKRAVDSKPKFHFPVRVVKLKAHKQSNCFITLLVFGLVFIIIIYLFNRLVSSSDSSCSESESNDDECEDTSYEELQRKKKHPLRLHEELWYNDPGEVCRESFFYALYSPKLI